MFGWTDDRMVADARQVWHEGCPSCGRVLAYRPAWRDWPDDRVAEAYLRHPAFETFGARAKEIYPHMGMSLYELIPQILDRSASLWYGANTRWVCTFCRCTRRLRDGLSRDWLGLKIGPDPWAEIPQNATSRMSTGAGESL